MLPLAPKQTESLAWVDALRGIAILGVVLVHCFYDQMPWFLAHLNVAQWVLAGQYGVQLFFVASAFTLARSWHRRRAEHRPLRNYLLRRWFRIAPLYFVGIAAYTTMVLLWIPDFHIPASHYTLKAIAAHLLFLHGWLPFAINNIMPGGWSIGVEMSFYLLVPWLATHLHRPRSALMAFAAAVPLAGICAYGAYRFSNSGLVTTHSGGFGWPVDNNTFLYFWLPTQLPVFILGFLAYGLLEDKQLQQWAPKRKHLVSAMLLACSLLGFWLISLGMSKDADPSTALPDLLRTHFFWLSPTFAGIASCSLLLALALTPWRLLVNPVTTFLGKLSYSLYIVHFIGAWIIAPWVRAHVPWEQTQPWGTLGTFAAGVLACLAFAIPVAMLTHRFIEKPGIKLGKSLIARWENAGRTARF